MKKYKIIILVFTLISFTTSCGDMLEVNDKQVLDPGLLTKASDMDGFVTAAYARLTENYPIDSPLGLWFWGSMRADDSYKGGGGIGDVSGWYDMETFVNITPNGWPIDAPWYLAHQQIGRCNTAIERLNNINEADYPEKETRIGEMKFIRAYTMFNIKTFWKYIPYIDENVIGSSAAFEAVPNRDKNYDNDQYLWEWILADFKDAESRLPMDYKVSGDIGRVSKNAATAMTAKTLLFMAYEQDERHQVTNINKARLEEALTYIKKLTDQEGSTLALCKDFGDNFDHPFDNATKEAVWEIQYSIDDGSSAGGKIDRNTGLNHPHAWGGFLCCGFHHMSYTMANAFKTGADGLPLFDDYNKDSYNDYIKKAEGGDDVNKINSGNKEYFDKYNFDPRLSHTTAVPGHPFKYDPDLIFTNKGSRDPAAYGYLKSIKEVPHPDCGCLMQDGWSYNSMNKRMIRYAEVLLWKAEIHIQLGQLNEALAEINKVRRRAGSDDTKARLRQKDGSSVLKYKCEEYKPGVNCTWDKDFAWKALQWEMRLEMACEGRRFFDLQRWGILEKTMNQYFAVEKNRFSWMNIARFTAGRDEYLPIPQKQINWSKGTYTQNIGY